MLRDNLVELIEPMLNSAGADPLALYIHTRTPASDDRLPCLKNPRPEGAESSLTESASSPFQAEPAQNNDYAFVGYGLGTFSFQLLLEWELKDGRRYHHCKPALRFIPALLELEFKGEHAEHHGLVGD